jgi:hypothetical protein
MPRAHSLLCLSFLGDYIIMSPLYHQTELVLQAAVSLKIIFREVCDANECVGGLDRMRATNHDNK